MTLAELVTKYRKEHGLSQRQLATMCGLSNGYISILEKNENPSTGQPLTPTLPVLRKLADGMDIPVSALCCAADDLPLFDGAGEDTAPAVPSPAPSETIGHRIRAVRESHGMTMKELADAAGVSEGTVSRWESGDIENMKQNRIQAIAAALHVSPAYLLGVEDDPALSRLAAQLNAAGRDRLIAYAEDLILSGRYTP